MTTYAFPNHFLWGAAASGPQTEGAEGKPHRSIWDSWHAAQPERFYRESALRRSAIRCTVTKKMSP